MRTINMLSSADLVKGQGVGSAYYEQVNLVSEGLKDKYKVLVNARTKCDIKHYHTINPEFYIGLSLGKLDKKSGANVGYVHFLPETMDESLDIPKPGRKLLYKYMIEFYSSMDYLVTVNPYFITELEKYGIPKEKVTYIPNYVSSDSFYPYSQDKISYLKQKWEIPLDKFVVLGVGQVQTRKGVLDFVETAKAMPDVYFIWAGGFSFGPMTEGYKELKALMTNSPENVNFIGIVDRENMNDIYNMADIMFLPSFSELFPMTVLESMCVRKPILLRDLDIYKNILFDYYLKGSSNEEFQGIIHKLMEDPEEYKKWSKKSFEGHIFYSKDNVLKMWEQFYDRVYDESCEKREAWYAKRKRKTKEKKVPEGVLNINIEGKPKFKFKSMQDYTEFKAFKRMVMKERLRWIRAMKEQQKTLMELLHFEEYGRNSDKSKKEKTLIFPEEKIEIESEKENKEEN